MCVVGARGVTLSPSTRSACTYRTQSSIGVAPHRSLQLTVAELPSKKDTAINFAPAHARSAFPKQSSVVSSPDTLNSLDAIPFPGCICHQFTRESRSVYKRTHTPTIALYTRIHIPMLCKHSLAKMPKTCTCLQHASLHTHMHTYAQPRHREMFSILPALFLPIRACVEACHTWMVHVTYG